MNIVNYSSRVPNNYQLNELIYPVNNLIYPKIIDNNLIYTYENESMVLINHVFNHLKLLTSYYPNFDSWLENKVFMGLYKNERQIILEWREDLLAGIAIVKNDGFEKKICCLRVQPEFQNKGLGIKLFEKSMSLLETDKPLLSISDNHVNLDNYLKIFQYFGFKQSAIYPDLYMKNATELAFNGLLD